MIRYAKIITLLLIVLAAPFACQSGPPFSDVQDKDWNLAEIRVGPESIIIDNSGDMFTLRFDRERVNGIGFPNHYFAPYLLADKQGMTIKAIAQTRMAALVEPEQLNEYEFFAYLDPFGMDLDFIVFVPSYYVNKPDALNTIKFYLDKYKLESTNYLIVFE